MACPATAKDKPHLVYDEDAHASYIYITEFPTECKVTTLQVGHGVMLDVDEKGTLVGVEILH